MSKVSYVAQQKCRKLDEFFPAQTRLRLLNKKQKQEAEQDESNS